MRNRFIRLAAWIAVVGAGLWVVNASALVGGLEGHQTRVMAHRGIHQIYAGTDRSAESCHASPVEPITHGFIENTIPSMAEAFALGAAVVELDVHLTNDGVFAVFHDWTLDCRTDGAGVVRQQSFADLRSVDLAYRIDDGTGTYPLRGTGQGAMPSLTEVLDAGLPGLFLINFKSNDPAEAAALAELLQTDAYRAQVYGVYGGAAPTRAAMSLMPDLRGVDRDALKSCLLRYMAVGWTGYVPARCKNLMLLVPQNYAGFLWGWPHRFTRRMARANSDVVLVGPYDGSGFTTGIDDAEGAAAVPAQFDGYVWTNRIEMLGPLFGAEDDG